MKSKDESAKPVVGQTRDAGFQVGVRRTFAVPPEEAWRLVTSKAGVRVWLGDGSGVLAKGTTYRLADGSEGEVRVWAPNSHLRLTWQPPGWPRPSTVQLRVIRNGTRTTIAFHQEHLPGVAERKQRRTFYTAALEELGRLFRNE